MKFYWHIHHDTLMEVSDNIEERIKYINEEKPKNEVELRLRLLKEVKGELPIELVEAGKAWDKARKVWNEAGKVYNEALEVWVKTGEVWNKAWKVYRKARKVYDEAVEVWNKAWKVYDKVVEVYYKVYYKYILEIEALHKQECLSCPWDGRTIFK